MINSCTLVGRIATDPEMRYTASGMAVVNFRLAVDRRRKSDDGSKETDFLDIVAFGKSGEFVAQYLDKGSLVGVEGRIQARDWQTNDGQTRHSVEVIANTVQALESRADAERRRAAKGTAGPSASAPPPAATAAPAPAATPGPAAPAPAAAPDSAGAPEGPISESEDPFGDQ